MVQNRAQNRHRVEEPAARDNNSWRYSALKLNLFAYYSIRPNS